MQIDVHREKHGQEGNGWWYTSKALNRMYLDTPKLVVMWNGNILDIQARWETLSLVPIGLSTIKNPS